MNTDRCIICERSSNNLDSDNPLTMEHIIPYALGNNSLKSRFLCKSCNSMLGKKIDSAFVDSIDMQLLRNQLRISGRNGKPNPFKKGEDYNGHVVFIDEDMRPRMIPHVNSSGNNIHIQAGNRDEVKEIAQKTLSRKGVHQDTIEKVIRKIDMIEPKQYQPVILFNFEYDYRIRLLAILKIAYEYACFKLEDNYFNDDRAKEIREILRGEINKSGDNVNLNIGVAQAPEEMRQVISCFHKMFPLHHLIMIQCDANNRLSAIVSLFLRFEYTFFVLLSNNASRCLLGIEEELFDVINISTDKN